jgi:N6-L-threonylcarbamoyladenine synthase
VSYLLKKLHKAVQETGITQVSLAGGVSANSELRETFREMGKSENWSTYIPDFQYCTDNAAMIAMAAQYQFDLGNFADQSVVPYARNTI